MIGVEVGQEDRLNSAYGIAHPAQVTHTVGACIHHKQALAGHNGNAGARCVRRRHGPAGPAQRQMQTIVEAGDSVSSHACLQAFGHDALRDACSLAIDHNTQQGDDYQNDECFFHDFSRSSSTLWGGRDSLAHRVGVKRSQKLT